MEDLVIAVLCMAVVWLAVRQLRWRQRDRLLERLAGSLANLDRRLSRVEEFVTAGMPAAAAAESAAPDGAAPQAAVAPAAASHVVPPVPVAARAASPQPFVPYTPRYIPPPPEQQRQGPAPPPFAPVPNARPSRSLEERLGQNWLNKLGIVILVIGIALFLGYQLRTLGPAGKSVIGFALSVTLLAGGLVLERRSNYRIFARAAIGGGWALVFFVSFAIYHVDAMKVLASQSADLVLMFLVAAVMVFHSLRYRSQVVTSLAFLLAFVTVGISQVTMFSLVAGVVLAAGLIYVSAREYWYELGLCGLVGVYLNHFLWLHRVLPNGASPGHPFAEFLPSAALLLLYWLLFRLFYVLRVPRDHRQEVVASITAILNSVGLMSLLKFQSSHPEWAFWGLLALGSAELVLAFVARARVRAAFIVLSTIGSVLLLAGVPFRFSGANWTFLWLVEAEAFFLAGVRLPERVFRRLGLLAGFAVAVKLTVADAARTFDLRQNGPDTSHHVGVTLTFLAAGALLWLNAEFAPRKWVLVASDELDRTALIMTSYLGAAMTLLGLWVFLPGTWTVVAWLVVSLALGWVSDRIGSAILATQTDLIALAAIVRIVAINLQSSDHAGHVSLRALTVCVAAALLYLHMRRKTGAVAVERDYIAGGYSWAASMLLGALLWYELQPVSVAVAWAVFGVVLFEIGQMLGRNYLRQQAYALLAASFVRLFFANLNVSSTHLFGPRLYTVLPMIAVYFWVYERRTQEQTREGCERSKLDEAAAIACAWAGTVAAASLVYFETRAAWVAIAWSVLALLLLAAGWKLRRSLLIAQSLVVLLAAAVRVVMFNLLSPAPLAVTPFTSRMFCVGAACGVMLLALPIAFGVRSQCAGREQRNWLWFALYRPEQPFFFVPVALLAALLAVQLRAGMITVGWSVLGVLVFLFALMVKERSYRLAGLSLLMLGVAKILCVDVWQASPRDRYVTLMVMGTALLLVSFLYSRYRETLLKLL